MIPNQSYLRFNLSLGCQHPLLLMINYAEWIHSYESKSYHPSFTEHFIFYNTVKSWHFFFWGGGGGFQILLAVRWVHPSAGRVQACGTYVPKVETGPKTVGATRASFWVVSVWPSVARPKTLTTKRSSFPLAQLHERTSFN